MWYIDPSSRLATTDMGRKLGAVPFLVGKVGYHLTQCDQGRGLPAYQVATIRKRYRQDRQSYSQTTVR